MITARFDDKELMSLIKITYIKFFVIVISMFSSKLLKTKITF